MASEQVYDFLCPHPQCGHKFATGFMAPGTWWETKCRRCKQFFFYGDIPKGVIVETFAYRCPHLEPNPNFNCRRLSHVGFMAVGTWFETKCHFCHKHFRFGEKRTSRLVSVLPLPEVPALLRGHRVLLERQIETVIHTSY